MANSVNAVLKLTFLGGLKAVLYFPVWWYTSGLLSFLIGIKNSIVRYDSVLGVSVWAKNIFTPVFGQADVAGRIVSFFLRLFNIIFRGLGLLIIIIAHIIALIAYIIAPLFIIWQIVIH